MSGLILFGVFAVCLIVGVPISISLGVSATAMILLAQNIMSPATIAAIPLRFYAGLDSVSIMAIAFFVLAGNLMTKGGISRRIVNFASILVGRVRGGMAIALVLACAFFAALSGSAPATVIAIGSMLYADMVKEGYPGPRTAGLLVVSGGLGPVIPPSIIMVIYCTLTGASVSSMFKQGLMVGVIICVVLIAEVIFF
ncbi:MAG: TRAP transporter large permease subunit, partial [Lawsonibacter sp.]|nr:TRAP transporter large permease subunit [Lawsonibacter sp.]